MRTVLYICAGNTCRSPMAEAIARHHVGRGLLGGKDEVFVASAGMQAPDGVPTTSQALEALARLGIQHHGRSKKLTDQMIRKADLIFCMTRDLQTAARALVIDSPADMEKIVMLDPDSDIEDPIGMGQEAYDALGKRLSKLVPKRLKEALPSVANNPIS